MHGAAGGSTNASFCQHSPAQNVHLSQLTQCQASAKPFHIAPLTLRQPHFGRPTLISSTGLISRRGAPQSCRAVAVCSLKSGADIGHAGAASTPRTQRLCNTKRQKCLRHRHEAHHPSHHTLITAQRLSLSSSTKSGGVPQGRLSGSLPRCTASKLASHPAPSLSQRNRFFVPLVTFSSGHTRLCVAARSLSRGQIGHSGEPEGGSSIGRPNDTLELSLLAGPLTAAFEGDTRVESGNGRLEDSNHAGRPKQTKTRRQKQKFKRARFTEIAPEEARTVLASQYSAAQGIPYRAPEEFRLWVQLMMAGPEHVILSEPGDYIFENGRRLVRPYFFEFVSHVKSRWAGQNIVDFFSNEFRQRDRQYYVSFPSKYLQFLSKGVRKNLTEGLDLFTDYARVSNEFRQRDRQYYVSFPSKHVVTSGERYLQCPDDGSQIVKGAQRSPRSSLSGAVDAT